LGTLSSFSRRKNEKPKYKKQNHFWNSFCFNERPLHLASTPAWGNAMKAGDLVRNKNSESGELGLFMGERTFGGSPTAEPYICAEVMWFERTAPNGDVVSTIQLDLIEVVSEISYFQQSNSPSNNPSLTSSVS
jgi:hypothetical protein